MRRTSFEHLMPSDARRPIEVGHPALFLDLDGTLLDIAPTPETVRVEPGLVELLLALREALGGAVAIVTGRRIADVDALLAPARFVAAGLHGAEYRTHETETIRSVAPHLPDELVAALRRLETRIAGVRVETKGQAVAVHWRDVPDAAPALWSLLGEILEAIPADLVLSRGRMVYELVPRHVSKGVALEVLSELPAFSGRTPVMIGDDVADAEAFATAERLGGIGLAVAGETWSSADAAFASPREVRLWLSHLLEGMKP